METQKTKKQEKEGCVYVREFGKERAERGREKQEDRYELAKEGTDKHARIRNHPTYSSTPPGSSATFLPPPKAHYRQGTAR